MATLPILTNFEVLLSDAVVRDLFTPGKIFKQDLVGPGASAGPVDMAGDRASDALLAVQMCSIQLEKESETVIRLFVTVFRTEGKDQNQQTDPVSVVSEVSVQTDHHPAIDSLTQTDTRHLKHSVVQTEEKRLHQSFCESSSVTDFNMTTQVDGVAMAVTASETSSCQTEVKTSDVVMQTDRNESPASVQTDPPVIRNIRIQTDRMPIRQIEVQTDSSMASMFDMEVQVAVETKERPMQTELIQQEVESQTDVSMASQRDGEVQASAEMTARPTQTEVKIGDGSCQTDMSMALRKDVESQCLVEVSDLQCQTELNLQETSSQTTMSISLQTEQETQASADVTDNIIQTDISQSLQGDQSTQMTTEVTDSFIQTELSQSLQGDQSTQMTTEVTDSFIQTELSQSLQGDQETQTRPEIEEPVCSQESTGDSHDVSLSQDDQFTQIIDHEEVGQKKRLHSEALKDGVAQTDPVTIIIGDASFLVKKLKSSAVSPSKVTTSGNEIEIELSADVATSNAPFETEEKENDLQCYTAPHLESPVLRSGPLIRGGSPAIMTRPGGGVRVRMPVTMQSPGMMRPSGTPRVHPGPPVRFQSPTMRAPVTASSTPRPPSRVSSGGTFSCPFCSLIFIDSPALYEHLSVNHQVDQKTKWKQPKGREGKTIIPRKPRSPEHGPPVLTPIEPLGTQSQALQFATPASRGGTGVENTTEDEGEEEVAHEAGLFEDPVEMSVVKRRRGRQPKAKTSDLDTSVLSDDDVQTSGKRKRRDVDSSNKRARAEGQWDDLEEDEDEEEEEYVPVKTSRRGGRTPRARTK